MFMETSAKAGHNVKSLFKKIAMSLPGMEGAGAATTETTTQSEFFQLLISNALLARTDHGFEQKLTWQRPRLMSRKQASASVERSSSRRFPYLRYLDLYCAFSYHG